MARIILIEDDEVFRETMARVLGDAGHVVKTATNGFDGMALVRAEPSDLVITDIVMPHGGLPTIRVLRNEFPKMPIIAISGSHVRLDMAGGLGADKMMPKPFTSKELLDAVVEVLAGKKS